jgi:uncharacterized protein (DUF1810 family)
MNQEKLNEDKYDLERFVTAQEHTYSIALSELRNGQKQLHWMWYIFPQIEGLGQTQRSKKYSIKSLEEAKEYFHHSILGERLIECVEATLLHKGSSASEIFGYPDYLKLKSSMTLFEQVLGEHSVFSSVLEKYFNGERDQRTLDLLKQKLKK